MPSKSVPDGEKKKPKVYYSARGGSRSKGADSAARANVASLPSPTALEAPLPRFTSSHFLRGGDGNEWNYVVEDGVLQRALEHDQLRVQELRWETYNHRLAKTGLRGGASIPKMKIPKLKVKTGRFAILRRRKDSITTSESGDSFVTASSPVTTPTSSMMSEKSMEQRLYELSIASSDDGQSVALSNFTAPTFMLMEGDEDDESGDDSDATESGHMDATAARARSFSLSSATSEDSLATPEVSPTGHGRFSFRSPGILVFKPDEPQPFSLDDSESVVLSSLELGAEQSRAI